MRRLHDLQINDRVLFKSAKLDFSKPGLTIIQGANLNSTARSGNAPKDTNAVGKSLLTGQLKDIAYPDGATGKAKDKVKQGSATLRLKVGTHAYEISQYMKGKTERYTILKDGVDITPDRAADQVAKVQLIFGMPLSLYEVTYYLDGRRPNPLRTGDTAQRKAFFTEFYRLTQVDDIRKKVSAEKARLKKDAAVLKELEDQHSQHAEVINAEQAAQDVAHYTALVKKRKRLVSQLETARAQHEFEHSHANTLKLLTKGKSRTKALGSALSTLTDTLSSVQKRVKDQTRFSRYAQAMEAYRDARKERNRLLEKFPELTKLSRKDIRSRITELEDLVRSANRKADKLVNRSNACQETWSARAQEVERIEAEIKALAEDKARCPTCGQKLKDKSHLEKEAKKLSVKLKNAIYDRDTARDEALAIQRTIPEFAEHVAAAQRKLDKQLKLRERLDALPDLPEKPEAPKGEPLTREELHALIKKEGRLEQRVTALEHLRDTETFHPFVEAYLSGNVEAFNADALAEAQSKLNKATKKLAAAEALVDAAQRQADQLKRLDRRIKELATQMEDYDVIDLLDRGFKSNTGVKHLMIKAHCTRLEAQVNSLAARMLPEPYEFRFDLDKQFHILVTRLVGGVKRTSDVRRLSGAEAGMFDFILALALISFLPKRMRHNVMVLDEINANFGPAAQAAFANVLPSVLNSVPKIIVVTPKINDYGPDAHYLTVVKKGAQSKVLEGKH